MHTGVWLGYLMERDHVDGKVIINWIFKKRDVEAWTGLIWLRIGTCGGRLCMR